MTHLMTPGRVRESHAIENVTWICRAALDGMVERNTAHALRSETTEHAKGMYTTLL